MTHRIFLFFTFAIATAWGVLKYRPQDFSSTEPFLAAFFLLFVGVAVLYALRQPLKLRGYVDSTLVFGRFRLDRSRRVLLSNGNRVRIGSRALEILLALTERAGAIISSRPTPDESAVSTALRERSKSRTN